MKDIKRLFLVIGLFIQGCNSENPLFKDEDGIKPEEAVIVYTFYTTDPSLREGDELFGSLKHVYLFVNWSKQDSNLILKHDLGNYLQVSGIKSHYVVATVPAGSYFLNLIIGSYTADYSLKTIVLPLYNNKLTPLTFFVRPGEVKYLGDIEMVKPALSWMSFQPLFKIHNRYSDAKKFMNQKYPSIAERLSEGLIQKSETQVLIEKKHASDLLKDVANEK
jgi:hypothetical protein